MHKIITLLNLLILCQLTLGQEYLNCKTYENFKSADCILQRALSLNYQDIETISYRLSGKLFWQGHYSEPKERRTLPNTINILAYKDSAYIQTDSVAYGNDIYIETGYFSNDSSIVIDSDGKVLSKGSEAQKQSNVVLYSPVTLLWTLLDYASSLRYLGFDKETNCNVVTYLSFGKQISLFINSSTYLIDRAEILKYSSIQGDYLLQYFFSDYRLTDSNLKCPHKLVIKEWGEVLQEFTYTYTNIEGERIDNKGNEFAYKEIANHLYQASYPTKKHYSYVVDFGDYLGVVEMPMSNSYMKRMDDFIHENIFNKPIKYAFLTHHHPDHAGGFAHFYKTGATIVTTELCSKYLKELLICPHLLEKDDNINMTGEGAFEIVKSSDSKEYSTKNISLTAIEFPDNGHTKEFVLYYFPESRILIVGDYFYMSSKIRGSHRAEILEEFIETNKIKVDRIYPTWAPVGMKAFCTMKELKESAKLYMDNE